MQCLIFTTRKQSLEQGNGADPEGLPPKGKGSASGGFTSRGSASGGSVSRGLGGLLPGVGCLYPRGRGLHPGTEVCIGGGGGVRQTPPRTIKVGGTDPTEMLSCLDKKTHHWLLQKCFPTSSRHSHVLHFGSNAVQLSILNNIQSIVGP